MPTQASRARTSSSHGGLQVAGRNILRGPVEVCRIMALLARLIGFWP